MRLLQLCLMFPKCYCSFHSQNKIHSVQLCFYPSSIKSVANEFKEKSSFTFLNSYSHIFPELR